MFEWIAWKLRWRWKLICSHVSQKYVRGHFKITETWINKRTGERREVVILTRVG